MNQISFEKLPALLENKAFAAWFLTELLGHPIPLHVGPERAMPWYSVCVNPDLRDRDTNGDEYAFFVGSSRVSFDDYRAVSEAEIITGLVEEMQKYALERGGEYRDLHMVMFCRANMEKSYYKLELTHLTEPLSGQEVPLQRRAFFHIFVVSNEYVEANAPGEIQRLLDLLGGKDLSEEDAARLSALSCRWTCMDRLRLIRKEVCARAYQNALDEGYEEKAAAVIASEVDEGMMDSWFDERIRFINSFACERADDFWHSVPSEKLADQLEVPVEMVEGLKIGRTYTLEDFKAFYRKSDLEA